MPGCDHYCFKLSANVCIEDWILAPFCAWDLDNAVDGAIREGNTVPDTRDSALGGITRATGATRVG